VPAPNLDEIFAKTLSSYDSDDAWEAVRDLQSLACREVFDQASAWCSSPEPIKRARGADILAQIGKTADHPKNSFSDESFAVVSGMLTLETEALPLASAIDALGHIEDPRAINLVALYRSHADAKVRFAVAFALGYFADDPLAELALIELTTDGDPEVRDWATFGLGVLGKRDSPEIREALIARLNDACDDAREEAMIGLAKRRDHRVLSPLIRSLESASVPDRAIEAATEMLGLKDEFEGWAASDFADRLRREFGM
jgi:HEAT repeat protein